MSESNQANAGGATESEAVADIEPQERGGRGVLARANDVLPGLIHLLPGGRPPLLPGPGGPPGHGRRALALDPDGGGGDRAQDPWRGPGGGRELRTGADQGLPPRRHRLPGPPRPPAGGPTPGPGGVPATLPARRLGLTEAPFSARVSYIPGARRPAERRGQGLCHGRHQHHQGAAAAQPAVRGRAAHVPRPLRPRGPLPPGGLRRQPDHLHQDPAPGGPGGHAPCCRAWRRSWSCSTTSWSWPVPSRRSATASRSGCRRSSASSCCASSSRRSRRSWGWPRTTAPRRSTSSRSAWTS